MNLSGLYSGEYVNSTYGDQMRETFERIQALPPARSDNLGRVTRVLEFAESHFAPGKTPRLLDVGSGLGVFPARMHEAGWRCTAIDPDERAARHALEVIGIEAVAGDFMQLAIASPETPATAALGRFDAITFNKVLEHVEDPVAMLARGLPLLDAKGFVYLEVPDGDGAAVEGRGREEFFIEHHHVFSLASAALLVERAGLCSAVVQSVREPSSKSTICVFATVP